MKIIKAKLSDAKEIANVEMSSEYKHENFNALKNSINLLKDKREHVFIAIEKNKIVGYISLRIINRIEDIGFLAVTKKYQNKGIGTKLIKFILKYASKKCKKLNLSVRKNNIKAIKLYKKLGFIIKIKENDKSSKLVMEKMLKITS